MKHNEIQTLENIDLLSQLRQVALLRKLIVLKQSLRNLTLCGACPLLLRQPSDDDANIRYWDQSLCHNHFLRQDNKTIPYDNLRF